MAGEGKATDSGIPVDLVYGPAHVASWQPATQLGEPGSYPYTRGIYPTMYRGRLWTFRQYAGLGTPEDTGARFRFLLEQGQTGLSVALDLPTQMGYDSDSPEAQDEVGRVGVAIDSLADMEVLFEGIPLDKISTSFTINGTAAIILAMYLALARKQGVPLAQVSGTTQNDILKEYVARGTWIWPPEPSIRLITDSIEFCLEHAPRFNPISIAGAHFHDAGATAIQELAYTLADAMVYVQAALDRGIPVDRLGRQLSFFFYTHNDFFEEVAKYRAGRRLWARIMKERFGATDPKAMMFRVGVVCGGSTLTIQQPLNNVVRVAYQCLASALGGVQSIFTAAWDEAQALPTEASAELALRTQQILAFETGVPRTVDPLGGSYFVESLTDAMEAAVERQLDRVLASGGMVRCIEDGIIQAAILEEAYRRQQAIDSGAHPVVGVNMFVRQEEPELELYQPDPDIPRRQVERLQRVRRERNGAAVRRALNELEQAARGKANLMPYIFDAVEAYATVGEISQVLTDVFGRFREPLVT